MANADRVLVIDDDHVVCELVSALTATMGLDCDVTGESADLLDSVSPATSLILLDLMMPGMDGIEVLRLLGERRCRARILLMSGMDKTGAGDRGEAGAESRPCCGRPSAEALCTDGAQERA